MGRKRGERSRVQESQDSSDEDESFCDTQTELNNEEKVELAGKLCNFLLQNEERKIPAKPADLRKLVLKDQANHFKECMTVAEEMMKDTFGYTIKQLSTKDFILIDESNLRNTCDTLSAESNMEVKGLLFIILSAIYMCDGCMDEGALEKFLNIFNIDLNPSLHHEVFGNVSKLLHQEFVRQKYLKMEVKSDVDPPVRSFLWGERAKIELSQKKVVESVSEIYGERMKPEMFIKQWRKALSAEEGNQESNTQEPSGSQVEEPSQRTLRTSQRRR